MSPLRRLWAWLRHPGCEMCETWRRTAADERCLNQALIAELQARQELLLACRDEIMRLRKRELRAAAFGQTFSRNVRGGVS